MRHVVFIIAVFLIGCGGGTSGTTSTDIRNVSGVVLDLSGAPITNAPMYMETNSTQISSSTDVQGQFALAVGADSKEIFYTVDVDEKPVQGEIAASLEQESIMRVGILIDKETLTSSNVLSEGALEIVNCPGVKFRDGKIIGVPTSETCEVRVKQSTDYSPLKESPVVLKSNCLNRVIPVSELGQTDVFSILEHLKCRGLEIRLFGSDRLLGISIASRD